MTREPESAAVSDYMSLLLAREDAQRKANDQSAAIMRCCENAMRGRHPQYWAHLAAACRTAAVAFDELAIAIAADDEKRREEHKAALAHLDELTAQLPAAMQEQMAPMRAELQS